MVIVFNLFPVDCDNFFAIFVKSFQCDARLSVQKTSFIWHNNT